MPSPQPAATARDIAAAYGLEPLPAEGGLFRRMWAGPADRTGRPAGSAILVLLTAEEDGFSAMHRLPVDEVWHFYRGDPVELLLLPPDGTGRVETLGGFDGHPVVQTVVPAGTWMGARPAAGGSWSLCGTTMAPGFVNADYEGGEAEELAAQYPEFAATIRGLCRAGAPTAMPDTAADSHETQPGGVPDPRLPSLAGSVALVTGASGGIGAGIAATFARAGAAVVVHGHRDEQAAEATARRIREAGGEARVVIGDLTDEPTCARLVDEAASWRGRLDAVVNSAGIQPVQPLDAMTTADWDAVLRADATAAFTCTQAAARIMAAQDTGGSITHIASIEGSQPAAGHAHYSSAKAALIMFARAAALEYGPRGVRVNTVSPGLVDRPGLAEQWPEGVDRWLRAAPSGRLGTPEDIGAACVFLASASASWLTGHDLVVDGGVGAHPTW